MNHIYSDHASSDMKSEEFRDVCKRIWEGTYDFALIDLTAIRTWRNIEHVSMNFIYLQARTRFLKIMSHMIKMQEKLLQKLVENTSHKDSFQIIVSDDSTRFTKKFNPPIQLKKNRPYEIALVNLETYYSIPNISNKNNTFTYSANGGVD